jgi:hypothetical protein
VDEVAALLGRVPDHAGFLGPDRIGQEAERLCRDFPGLSRREAVGHSAEGRPIELLTVGHGSRPVLLLGVPHPNEPVGTLTALFLARLLCEDEGLRVRLGVTLWIVPIADPDGLALNASWLAEPLTLLGYARGFYRPPHHEQVEWSYPVDYRTLRFNRPAPETAVVMRVMERVRPQVFFSLHNSGFGGVYFYASSDRPALFGHWRALAGRLGMPLHLAEPEVPYLEEFGPATYRLFGIADTYEYFARTLDGDPAVLIEAGTCGDDWLRRVCTAFSLVCEVPFFTAPAIGDGTGAGLTRREALLAGHARAREIHGHCADALGQLGTSARDERLLRSLRSYVAKTPSRLQADVAYAESPDYDREATRSQACAADLGTAFYHLLYLGEAYRAAVGAGADRLATALDARLTSLAADLEGGAGMKPLPLRSLVAMQAGAGLLTLLARAD